MSKRLLRLVLSVLDKVEGILLTIQDSSHRNKYLGRVSRILLAKLSPIQYKMELADLDEKERSMLEYILADNKDVEKARELIDYYKQTKEIL